MRPLLDLLVPPCCDGCGRPARPPWCEQCESARVASLPPADRCCPLCADEDGVGHPCWRGSSPVAGLVTLGPWTGGMARAVARAKLAGRREVLVAAGEALGRAVSDRAWGIDVVVAVPTDRRRARLRGGDHAAALASGVAAVLGRPVVRPFARVAGQPDRASSGGHREVAAVVTPTLVAPASVAGRRALVVDDVVTTGATLHAVATSLTVGGAGIVRAATVGRAGRHALRADPTADRQVNER